MEEDSKKMVEESLEHLQLYLGLSLVAGFVFMLLIDQLSPSHSHGGGGAGGLGGWGLENTICILKVDFNCSFLCRT